MGKKKKMSEEYYVLKLWQCLSLWKLFSKTCDGLVCPKINLEENFNNAWVYFVESEASSKPRGFLIFPLKFVQWKERKDHYHNILTWLLPSSKSVKTFKESICWILFYFLPYRSYFLDFNVYINTSQAPR